MQPEPKGFGSGGIRVKQVVGNRRQHALDDNAISETPYNRMFKIM